MNGVHDLGGMHGMGPIQPEMNEPVFHARWEERVFAMVRAMGAWRKWNIDASRHQRELIPGPQALSMSYYEKWLAGLIELMIAKGLVTRAEIDRGHASPGSPKATPALAAAAVSQLVAKGVPSNRAVQTAPRFKSGQSVRARNINPVGHTRLPRYVRGKVGTIESLHGAFVFPDTNAHFKGENPQHLYSVRFAAQELWGEDAATQDMVYIDLWDEYLDPA
jgi:nitrile hydratase subunit beta